MFYFLEESKKKGEPKSEYDSVNLNTRSNFKSLVDFWHELPQQLNLIGWAIGDDSGKEGLISEFLVHPNGNVTLYAPETLIACLDIPNMPRRMAHSLACGNYEVVYDGLKQPDRMFFRYESRITALYPMAQEIDSSTDAQILFSHSTTPTLEPFYFCQNMRDLAKFILVQNPKFPLPTSNSE